MSEFASESVGTGVFTRVYAELRRGGHASQLASESMGTGVFTRVYAELRRGEHASEFASGSVGTVLAHGDAERSEVAP